MISGLHCSIQYNEEENVYFVTDYSSNGTFSENRRLLFETPVAVKCGTVLTLGPSEMVVRLL